MAYSSVPSFISSSLFFHFIRSFAPLFVILILTSHQLLFQPFTDPNLSVFVYSLCFLVLSINSFALFFCKEDQKGLSFYLLFIDAFFLSALVAITGLIALFLIFILAFIQSFLLAFSNKIFQSLLFLLCLSIGLPLAFLWEGGFSFEDRWFLSILSCVILAVIFCFSWIFFLGLNFFENKKLQQTAGSSDDLSNLKASFPIGMSLDLARKLKPVLNSLIKYFPENKNVKDSVLPSFFSPKKGRDQLKQMRNFILDFIEYAETENESLLEDVIDLRELLKSSLKKMEKHLQRPETLIQTVKLPVELKVKGSAVHLEKCFEHILINSFEALKNQDRPELYIQGYSEKSLAVLKFLDNGHGIETEDMKKLFDPLFSRRFGLRGLGLAYIQKIIKAHKASLNIESSDKGTAVIIKFPLISDFYDSSVKSTKQKYKKVA